MSRPGPTTPVLHDAQLSDRVESLQLRQQVVCGGYAASAVRNYHRVGDKAMVSRHRDQNELAVGAEPRCLVNAPI